MKNQRSAVTKILALALLLWGGLTLQARAGAAQSASFVDLPQRIQLDSAAQLGLPHFVELAGGDRYLDLGLSSVEEARLVTLGNPILIYQLGIADLRNYQGDNAIPLLTRVAQQVVYPLQAGSESKSAESLFWNGSQWVVFGYGNSNWIRFIEPLLQAAASGQNQNAGNLFVVRILGLSMEFLGYKTGSNQLTLIAEGDNPELNLSAGQAVPAEQVFLKLVPLAQAYNIDQVMGTK